jgi:hypothetical protein
MGSCSVVEQKSPLSENVKKSAVGDARRCQPVEFLVKLCKAGGIAGRLFGGRVVRVNSISWMAALTASDSSSKSARRSSASGVEQYGA